MLLFYRRIRQESGYVTPCIILIDRSVIQLSAGIFSNARLVPPLEFLIFFFYILVAIPYDFLDVGLDFQANTLAL